MHKKLILNLKLKTKKDELSMIAHLLCESTDILSPNSYLVHFISVSYKHDTDCEIMQTHHYTIFY